MTCGSVEYPLMKRTRILKVNRDSFILPLFNPERYWKISLFTDDYWVIHDLEKVFAMTCQFHDFTSDQFSDQRDYIQERTTTPIKELRNDQESFERERDCGFDTLLVPISCEGKESPIDMITDGFHIEQDLEGGNAHVVDLDSTQEMENLLSTNPLENIDSRNSNQELVMPDLEPLASGVFQSESSLSPETVLMRSSSTPTIASTVACFEGEMYATIPNEIYGSHIQYKPNQRLAGVQVFSDDPILQKYIPKLEHPMPVRPPSQSSLASILDQFRDYSDDDSNSMSDDSNDDTLFKLIDSSFNNKNESVMENEHSESTLISYNNGSLINNKKSCADISSWMDARTELETKSKNINQRYSLKFKQIDIPDISSSRRLTLSQLQDVNKGSRITFDKLSGKDVLKNSKVFSGLKYGVNTNSGGNEYSHKNESGTNETNLFNGGVWDYFNKLLDVHNQ
ncbi:unnamed protein product [Ambrosiozyma monospora]|uniref:Inheritance of peroxisomes protein 1 n=1 Tax=Ambrosiozyma monospora TaxID=43982 RepID=A0A9W7DKX3_AMBMO|nr:unnamed protein product [Ambrosiozyma monospora]